MKIKIKKVHPDAKVPVYKTPGAACFDLYAATVNGRGYGGAICDPGEPVVCGTGLAFEIPDGFAMLLFSRSGYAFVHNARLANGVGVIDSDYRGEVMVKITSDHQDGMNSEPLHIRPGYRVAQAMVIRAEHVDFVFDELGATERGDGGLGHTGHE